MPIAGTDKPVSPNARCSPSGYAEGADRFFDPNGPVEACSFDRHVEALVIVDDFFAAGASTLLVDDLVENASAIRTVEANLQPHRARAPVAIGLPMKPQRPAAVGKVSSCALPRPDHDWIGRHVATRPP